MPRGPDDRVGPRSWYWATKTKLLVAVIVVIVLLLIMIVVNPGAGSGSTNGMRASQVSLERQVSAANDGATAHCSRHRKDGARWACDVGDRMDPECYVVDVDAQGHWRIENQPRLCHYP